MEYFFTKLNEEDILYYMNEALKECYIALQEGEVPVGCIFLYVPTKQIIARGHNLTNKTKNATTHAEINCINSLYEIFNNTILKENFLISYKIENESNLKDIFQKSILFVSCEPCIMCAYALSLIKINKVYFGCENDKFGGNGSILTLNKYPIYNYESQGGYLKHQAIDIFRKFYIRGNEKAPEHKRQRKIISD